MKGQDRMRFSSSSFFSVEVIYICLHWCGSPVTLCCLSPRPVLFVICHNLRGVTAHVSWGGQRWPLSLIFLCLEMAVYLYLHPPFSERYVSQHQVHVCYMSAGYSITNYKSPLRMKPSLLCLPVNPCLLLICEHTAADMEVSGYPSIHTSPDSVQNEERSQQGLGKQPGRSGCKPARPRGGWARTDGHQRRLHPQVRGPGFQDALSRGLAG